MYLTWKDQGKDMGTGHGQRCAVLWTLMWLFRYTPSVSSEVLTKQVFFIAGGISKVTLPHPPLSRESKYQWMWTPHNGRQFQSIVTISRNKWTILNGQNGVFQRGELGLSMEPLSSVAGVFCLAQTEPHFLLLARFEVFALEITPQTLPQFNLGSDVSLSCKSPHMPEAATLQWETKDNISSYTTLFHNHTAYVIIHSVDPQNIKAYDCVVRINTTLVFEGGILLKIKTFTHKTHVTLFRESGNSSEVYLRCRSVSEYSQAIWSKTSSPGPVVLTSSERTNARSQLDRFSSPAFSGVDFPMHISPLIFEDGGEYTCEFINYIVSARVLVKLITIQVSVVPSGGEGGEQSMVLTCELSQLSDVPVTLAWLRREGREGLMVQQEVLTVSRLLSMTLPSLRRDQLIWECVVFSQGLLRARVPLNLTDIYNTFTPVSPSPNAVNSFQVWIIVACSVLLFTGTLCVALLLYYRGATHREAASRPVMNIRASPPPTSQGNITTSQHRQGDPVYGNITNNLPDQDYSHLTEGENDLDIHYSCVSLTGLIPREQNGNSETSGDAGVVIYSAVCRN